MVPEPGKSLRNEYIAKIIITLVFLGGFALFVGWMLNGPGFQAVERFSWIDLALLGLATYRMGHLISYDRVMEPLRALFTDTVHDPSGAGDSVEPKGIGFQNAIGQLLCCPICSGTWAAAILVYAYYLFPGPARVMIIILAVIGIGEILNSAGELFSWGGQYARTMSGARTKSLQKDAVLRVKLINPDAMDGINVDQELITRGD